ncbi:MAG: hypothetical protein HY747_07840, partial [Elusimicrobia bacterium]|nr:hypothetical protein [Elusimicrobiota bacterium]
RFPPLIFARGEAPLGLRLRYPAGFKGALAVKVRDLDAKDQVWQSTLNLSGMSPQDFELSLAVPRLTGEKHWEVQVEKPAWDALAADNSAAFKTQVLREKRRVLYLCGRPSFDYSYLRELIRSKPFNELVSFVILRNPEDTPPFGESELSLIPFPAHEIFTNSLKEFDVFVLQDFGFSRFQLPPQYLDNMLSFVRQGGGFIFIAGTNVQKAPEYRGPFLREAFGLELPAQESLSVGSHAPVLHEISFWNKVFPFHPDQEKNRQVLDRTLASDYVVYPHRFLFSSQPSPYGRGKQADKLILLADLKNTDGDIFPALVFRELDKGRAAWIGFSGSWLWKAGPGAHSSATDFYDAFWEGVLNWTSRETAASEEFKIYAEPAGPGRFKMTARLEEGPKNELRLEILPGRQKAVLAQKGPDSGIYEGFVEFTPPAKTFKARAVIQGREIEALVSLETINLNEDRRLQDFDFLEALAQASGGALLGSAEDWRKGVPEAYDKELFTAISDFRREKGGISGGRGEERGADTILLIAASGMLFFEWLIRRWKGLSL